MTMSNLPTPTPAPDSLAARALQMAQTATINDVPADERAKLEMPPQP